MRLESGVFSNWQTVNARGIKPTFFDVTVLPKLPEFQLATTILRTAVRRRDDVWGSISLNTPWGIPFQVLTSKILQRSLQPFLYCYTGVRISKKVSHSCEMIQFNIWNRDHCAIVIQYVLANPSFLFLCISLLPLKSESNVNVQYELLYTVLNPTFILLLLLTFNPQSRKR